MPTSLALIEWEDSAFSFVGFAGISSGQCAHRRNSLLATFYTVLELLNPITGSIISINNGYTKNARNTKMTPAIKHNISIFLIRYTPLKE